MSAEEVPRRAHMFWSTTALGSPDVEMPSYAFEGLKSAVAAFPGGVEVAHYGKITNLPEGAKAVDARPYLDEKTKDDLLSREGVDIAHVADVVRFKMAAKYGGWVVDADTLWLRPAPKGLHFATLWSKKSGQGATENTRDKRGTPFTVPSESAFANDLEKLADQRIRSMLARCPRRTESDPDSTKGKKKCKKNDWADNIQATGELIDRHNFHEYESPGHWFAPVPFWKPLCNYALKNGFGEGDEKARCKYKVTWPTTSQILSQSYCVPTSFVFSERNGDRGRKAGVDVWQSLTLPQYRESIIAAAFKKSLEFQGRSGEWEAVLRSSEATIPDDEHKILHAQRRAVSTRKRSASTEATNKLKRARNI